MKSRTQLLNAIVVSTMLSVVPFVVSAQDVDSSSPLLADHIIEQFGEPPSVPSGPLSPAMQFAARVAFIDSSALSVWDTNQEQALAAIGRSGDPRLVWIIGDMMRFISAQVPQQSLIGAASELLGKSFDTQNAWQNITNHLIAWDIPQPPKYLDFKSLIFTVNVPGWEPFFVEGDIDWRLVSWGGVLADDRAFDTTDSPCRCIPAIDNPQVSTAEETDWLDDKDIVFGIEINGEARAYPRRIMEVRELVNDTLGGRDIGVPYCTLCGSAQAFFTDQLAEGIERPVLRTSGLLSRSNKVMYDLNTFSLIDTFRGTAVTGPLADRGLKLKQVSVLATEWGAWKREYPHTTVPLERYAFGRDPDFRNGRDANGPIFPVGDVDPRLPVHEDVIGALTGTGLPVAFSRASAFLALSRGEKIVFEGVELELGAGGIRVIDDAGSAVPSHQAFWFAWSQFYPETSLWVQ